MYCKISVDLLNPTTRVKEKPTQSIYGEITTAYDYLSTGGYPFMEKRYDGGFTRNFLNPRCIMGGLVCFGNELSSSNFFKLEDNLIAYGTKYSSDYSSFSSKYGKKVNEEFAPAYVSQTWEFGTQQGNGIIKSIGLTNQMSAHCMDTDSLQLSCEKGNDFSNTLSLSPDADSVESEDVSMYKQTSTGDRTYKAYIASSNYLKGYNTSNSPYWVYFSNKYVFFIESVSFNQLVNSQRVSTFNYLRVDKEFYYRYVENTCATYRDYFLIDGIKRSNANYVTGSFTINSGSNSIATTCITYNTSAVNVVEDCAYIAFMVRTSSSTAASGDYSGGSRSAIFYIIEGEEVPAVTAYDTVYAVQAVSSSSTGGAHGSLCQGSVVFFKDHTYAYAMVNSTSSPTEYKVVHRRIASSTLLWSKTYSSRVTVRLGNLFKNEYRVTGALSQNAEDSGGQYISEVYAEQSNQLKGYYMDTYRASGAVEPVITGAKYHPLCIDADNPAFIVNPTVGYILSADAEVNRPLFMCRGDYLAAKANFVTPIEKTSDYIMQIKVEAFLD